MPTLLGKQQNEDATTWTKPKSSLTQNFIIVPDTLSKATFQKLIRLETKKTWRLGQTETARTLSRLTSGTVRNLLQKAAKTLPSSNVEPIFQSPDESAADKDEYEILDRALTELAEKKPNWAEAIRLKHFENRSQQDIASILGVGVSTISDWIGDKGLKLALKELRNILIQLQKSTLS